MKSLQRCKDFLMQRTSSSKILCDSKIFGKEEPMELSNKVSLQFNTKLTTFEKINDSFLKAKCYVLALGKNKNKSYFSKENVDKAYPSLAYIPVVGHLMQNENGKYYLGGHDVKLAIEEGKYVLKSICVPFGVALPSEVPQYEDVIEPDGAVAKYLVCDVIIWIGRYPELSDAFYNNEIYFSQSMEIFYTNSKPLEEDPTYTDIIDFSFDALCMLNKSDDPKFNINPCFPSSSFKPFSSDGSFNQLFNDFKKEISATLKTIFNQQGGNDLDKKLELLSKYNKATTDLDFSIDGISIEDLETKLKELYGEKQGDKEIPVVEPASFSATYRQKRDALSDALSPEIVKDVTGNIISETYYYVSDFDDEFVFVERDSWTADNYDSKHGRMPYTFDATNLTAKITGDFEEMILTWLTIAENTALQEERAKFESTLQDYEQYKLSHSVTDSDYQKLVSFKEKYESDKRDNDEKVLFERFKEKIGNTVEFEDLQKNKANYSIADLEKECIYIVGLYAAGSTPLQKKDSSLKFSVDPSENPTDDPIEATYKKYLKK